MKLSNNVQLDHVFTIREYRTLGHGNTLSYGGTSYTLADSSILRFDAKTVVEVRQTLSGEVFLWHRDQALLLKKTERPERKQQQKKKASSALQRKPADNHPWKTTYDTNLSKGNTKRSAFQDAMYSQHNSYSEAPW
nr:hypothetical protein [Paenibacillus harenae]